MPTYLRAFAWFCWLTAFAAFSLALYEWRNLPGGIGAATSLLAFQTIGAIIGAGLSLLILGTLLRAAAETLELLRRGVRAVEYLALFPPAVHETPRLAPPLAVPTEPLPNKPFKPGAKDYLLDRHDAPPGVVQALLVAQHGNIMAEAAMLAWRSSGGRLTPNQALQQVRGAHR